MPLKQYLLAPGPTPVPEAVALAMAQPIPHHRSPAFEALFARCREGLQWAFETTQDVLIYAASGTGMLEAALVNLCSPGDEIVYVNGGKFGERWGKLAKAYGLEAHELVVPWGQAVAPAEVAAALRDHPRAVAVCVQASESSTGVAHPVQELAAVTGDTSACLVVDAVSALGAVPLPMDAWGIDVLLCGSQKALMLPPGLAFSAQSPKAWAQRDRATLPRFYFDWGVERDVQRKNQTAWTPAISLLIGLGEVLRLLRREGREAIYARHLRLAEASRSAMRALGLELFAHTPSNTLTTVKSPVDSEQLVERLREGYGVTLVGGQDRVKGKIFRLAHLGFFDDFDIVVAIAALERALADLGYKPMPFGTGVGAALAVMADASRFEPLAV